MKPDSFHAKFLYQSAESPHTSRYLWPPLMSYCQQFQAKRVLDVGCGNGAFCAELVRHGFEVVGCDPSQDGIRLAREHVPAARFHQLGVEDDPAALSEKPFDVVISTEVIEHLELPRNLPRFALKSLRPGGSLLLSTPYHGYLKNLMLSLTDRWDSHLSPFWDGGHIKFWSRKTLTRLLEEEGFQVTRFMGAGRGPYLWKSMILAAAVRKVEVRR